LPGIRPVDESFMKVSHTPNYGTHDNYESKLDGLDNPMPRDTGAARRAHIPSGNVITRCGNDTVALSPAGRGFFPSIIKGVNVARVPTAFLADWFSRLRINVYGHLVFISFGNQNVNWPLLC
jgi:hypothetical protein